MTLEAIFKKDSTGYGVFFEVDPKDWTTKRGN